MSVFVICGVVRVWERIIRVLKRERRYIYNVCGIYIYIYSKHVTQRYIVALLWCKFHHSKHRSIVGERKRSNCIVLRKNAVD